MLRGGGAVPAPTGKLIGCEEIERAIASRLGGAQQVAIGVLFGKPGLG